MTLNKKQSETFVNTLLKQYRRTHKAHRDLIDSWTKNLVSDYVYFKLDNEYTIKLETLRDVMKHYLDCKKHIN